MIENKKFIEIKENLKLWVETFGKKKMKLVILSQELVQTVRFGRIDCVIVSSRTDSL